MAQQLKALDVPAGDSRSSQRGCNSSSGGDGTEEEQAALLPSLPPELYFFEIGSHYTAQVVLELTIQTRLVWNSEIYLPLLPIGKIKN